MVRAGGRHTVRPIEVNQIALKRMSTAKKKAAHRNNGARPFTWLFERFHFLLEKAAASFIQESSSPSISFVVETSK